MKRTWQYEMLQKEFVESHPPQQIEGFHKGSLLAVIPNTPLEFIGSIATKVWLPWKGKVFDAKTHMGENIVPLPLAFLLKMKIKNLSLKKDYGGVRCFPFKTIRTKGLLDRIDVLQLSYDLEQNPPKIRNIIDELVLTERNYYLGKAYVKTKKQTRIVAFFRLEK